ncbi:DUF4405 domain-containing protein [Martelella alba]|uniref:DUF4405 domain-containing protein n=1 Tax=Martelella alba TaxID=2590451 RepID=A0A506UIL9_9HYPH|nr:DUF4405 domain-containing protein [Martelella alba]TPW33157.1 DUF4405 domain-containing protein [Martelella alba]
MPKIFSRYATPFITGLFLVSAISGVALFFNVQMGLFHNMHVWLSMVLLIPFMLHIWKNWRPFSNYFKHWPMALALIVSLAGGLYYAYGSVAASNGGSEGGGRPEFALLGKIQTAPVSDVAPLLDLSDDDVTRGLQTAGFIVAGPDDTIASIAKNSSRSPTEVYGALLKIGN